MRQYSITDELSVGIKQIITSGYSDEQLMSVNKFIEYILNNCFIDYDGFAEFIFNLEDKEWVMCDNIYYSIDEDTVYINNEAICSLLIFVKHCNIKKVVWYNR